MIRRCVSEDEIRDIFSHCHGLEIGGHFSTMKTVAKVWQSGFFWPKMHKDTRSFIIGCDEVKERETSLGGMKCLKLLF